MDKKLVVRLHSSFEDMARKVPDSGTEFWCARDLQMLLGYTKWQNFIKVIDKAITSCVTAGQDPRDHFTDISKMVDIGSASVREIDDIALTRYACYLIAQCVAWTPRARRVGEVAIVRIDSVIGSEYLSNRDPPSSISLGER